MQRLIKELHKSLDPCKKTFLLLPPPPSTQHIYVFTHRSDDEKGSMQTKAGRESIC